MTYQFEKFMLEIGPKDRVKRLRLVELQGIATRLIRTTDCENAHWLAQLCSAYATAYIYADVSEEVLAVIHRVCQALMVAAMHAEALNDRLVRHD